MTNLSRTLKMAELRDDRTRRVQYPLLKRKRPRNHRNRGKKGKGANSKLQKPEQLHLPTLQRPEPPEQVRLFREE